MDALDPVTDGRRGTRRTGRPVSLAVPAYVAASALAGGLWFVAGTGTSFVAELGAFGPLTLASGVVSVLAGAAFHLRHPQGRSTHPAIALGLALQAAGGFMAPTGAILVTYGWMPAALGNPGAIELAAGLSVATSVVGVLATAALWMGVRRARRRPDSPGTRPAVVAIWLLAGLVLLNNVANLGARLWRPTSATTFFEAQSFVINVVQYLLGAALAAVLLAGARAGERPNPAWWLAASGKVLVLAGMFAFPLVVLIAGPLISPALYVQVPQAVSLAGSLLMLAAFTAGLPSDPSAADPRA